MREIKFRGWNGKKWVYGDLTISPYGTPYIGGIAIGWSSVKKETIGQYTGMKDCNGTEIYESDIVTANYCGGYDGYGYFYDRPFVVRWSDKLSCFYLNDRFDEMSFEKMFEMYDGPGCIRKVIGNIYENPELMGGADE